MEATLIQKNVKKFPWGVRGVVPIEAYFSLSIFMDITAIKCIQ
jgi:hypothetical protein